MIYVLELNELKSKKYNIKKISIGFIVFESTQNYFKRNY
jgi:hypothetical protein